LKENWFRGCALEESGYTSAAQPAMKEILPFLRVTAGVLALVLASCATSKTAPGEKPADGVTKFVNPFPPGTYDHFKAEKDYPKTSKVWKNEELLAKTNESNSHIVISIEKQRGFFMNGEDIVMDYPVSTGKPSRPTPPGDYKILEKQIDKASTSFGKIVDAKGDVVLGEADSRTDAAKIPEGGKFVGAPMPYWMRLTWDGVGHHIGNVPRYPASHACVRGPRGVIPIIYGKVKVGTPVSVH
jgi:lipoprotein-anchoring transpeptidase ErfK/SrfK